MSYHHYITVLKTASMLWSQQQQKQLYKWRWCDGENTKLWTVRLGVKSWFRHYIPTPLLPSPQLGISVCSLVFTMRWKTQILGNPGIWYAHKIPHNNQIYYLKSASMASIDEGSEVLLKFHHVACLTTCRRSLCNTRCKYILSFAEDLFDVFKYAVLWLTVQLGDQCLAIVCNSA